MIMTRWVSVGKTKDFPEGKVATVTVNNHDLCLANVKGEFYAIENRCPHRGGQLADGTLFNTTVVCPLHAWDFDVRSGVSDYNPKDKVATYTVKVEEGEVKIDADAVQPEGMKAGYLERWARHGDSLERSMDSIHKLSQGMSQVTPMGTTKPVPGFDSILFAPAQLARLPLLEYSKVETATVIGSKARKPLKLMTPVLVSHMSFGSLSKEAKVAIAKGTAAVGTAMGSGEGGLLPEAQEQAGAYIFEMASGYFGWNESNIRKASAIEVKIGQSAKPGLGGLLPGKKVTEEIAKVRGIPAGQPIQSPSRFPDIHNKKDLKKRVAWIKKKTKGPVGVKFVAGHIEEDIDVALYAGADWITIDGRGGGTGAAESFMKDNFGVPLVYAIPRARAHLDKKKSKIELIVTGRLRTPDEFLKALALGADAVAIATAAMMAIGCQQYRACNNDSCPVGIATQRQDLRKRFSIEQSAKLLENYLKQSTEIMKKMSGALGRESVHDLTSEDLITTDHTLAKHTSMRHAGF